MAATRLKIVFTPHCPKLQAQIEAQRHSAAKDEHYKQWQAIADGINTLLAAKFITKKDATAMQQRLVREIGKHVKVTTADMISLKPTLTGAMRYRWRSLELGYPEPGVFVRVVNLADFVYTGSSPIAVLKWEKQAWRHGDGRRSFFNPTHWAPLLTE